VEKDPKAVKVTETVGSLSMISQICMPSKPPSKNSKTIFPIMIPKPHPVSIPPLANLPG
jgi:hypothetical protein